MVYITEQIAKDMGDIIDRYKDSLMPAIILIPSNQGSLGIGMRNVKKSVERAIGADILFRDISCNMVRKRVRDYESWKDS